MTPDLLRTAVGCSPEAAARFADPLSAACAFYGITTPTRLAAFLAQIGHESSSLRYTRELWGPTPAQARYEGRADLGNTEPGDGERFKGHGLTQTTGRHNHARVRDRLRERFPHLDVPDFEADPEALSDPQWAAFSAADYWDDRGLNALADAGDFERITRKINGGLNGYADRLARWKRAREAFGAPPAPQASLTQQKEQEAMIPFVAAALPALIQAAPALIRIFGNSPQAEKNAKAAEVVANIAKEATGEPTVEGAVNAIRADPAMAAAYREAVHARMGQLVEMTERINAMEQANIGAARQYNRDEPLVVDLPWLRLRFIHLLSLVFVAFSGWFVAKYWPDLTPELKGAVITLMVIAGWNGVKDYWMGSSSGSERKTAMLSERRE